MPLGRLLSNFAHEPLSHRARRAVGLAIDADRTYARNEVITSVPQPNEKYYLFAKGWAACNVLLPHGAGRVTDFFLPGEFCALPGDASKVKIQVVALEPVNTHVVDRDRLFAVAKRYPQVAIALLQISQERQAALRRSTARFGQKASLTNLVEVVSDLCVRQAGATEAGQTYFDLPITYRMLASAIGITEVHLSRLLQPIREAGIVARVGRSLRIHDLNALRQLDHGNRISSSRLSRSLKHYGVTRDQTNRED